MDMTAFQDASSIHILLSKLSELGIHRLDTGARYPPMKPGRAEELIGETKELSGKFVVDTKVYTDTQKDGSGDLTGEAIERSVKASVGRLGRDDVTMSFNLRLKSGNVINLEMIIGEYATRPPSGSADCA